MLIIPKFHLILTLHTTGYMFTKYVVFRVYFPDIDVFLSLLSEINVTLFCEFLY